MQFRPVNQSDANGNVTQMGWSGDGKRLNSVTDAANKTTSFTYNANETLKDSTDAQQRKTEYTYTDTTQPRLPTRIRIFDAPPNGTTVLRHQTFTYDAKGRVLTEGEIDPANGTTLLQETTRTYYTSGTGNGLLQTLTRRDLVNSANDQSTTYTYDFAGRVIKTQQSSLLGSCQFSYTVYDPAGNVTATVCSRVNITPPATAAAAAALYDSTDPDKHRITTHEYDSVGRRFKTTVNAGAPFAQTAYTVYDALDRPVRTIANWDGTTNPVTTAQSAFPHGTDNTLNLVTETAYNARGLVRKQTDVLGSVMLMGYDDADRLVRTLASASQPAYNNDYTGTAADPGLSAYVPNTAADKDVLTQNRYDAAGNLVQTIDPLGVSSFTVYDALNRPVKTVRAAKVAATTALNPGDSGYNAVNDPRSSSYVVSTFPDRDLIETTEYDALGRVIRTQRLMENRLTAVEWETTLYGFDPLGRQVKVVRVASQPTYNIAADPALNSYVASTNPDQDLITRTVYDVQGRVLYSEDTLGLRTWQAYDGLNRVVKTITNAIGTATDGSANDPRSASYVPSSKADEDLITRMVYDSDGRVQTTEDVLGRKTYNVYDSLGRTIRTVTHWVDQGESPALWVYSNGWYKSNGTTAIDQTDLDRNLVMRTEYDAQGRVTKTIENLGIETRTEYDVLGRRTRTIRSYANGVYDPSEPDIDLIETMTYDLAGRVLTRALTNNGGTPQTRTVYDALGRTVKTIGSYTAQGTSDPAAWVWDATDKRWELLDGTAVGHGSTLDRNRISETTYNKAGQVVATRDARGTRTTFSYDAAGRRLTTAYAEGTTLALTERVCYDKAGRTLRRIAAWSGTGDPDARAANGTWTFNPAAHGTDNDIDLISVHQYDRASRQTSAANPAGNVNQTSYRKDGQVVTVTDPLSVQTVYRYDKARRRVKVVQSYQAQGGDPAPWAWRSNRWEDNSPTGNAVAFGTQNDRNLIVEAVYDKAGRTLSLRDPRGGLTTFSYDRLDRRRTLTNPLNQTHTTSYGLILLAGPINYVTGETYRLETDAQNFLKLHWLDRVGRVQQVLYLNEPGSPKPTADVNFTLDALGRRLTMTEKRGTATVRRTTFTYDEADRLTAAAFDNDGNGTTDESVSYSYDVGGNRTALTLPGSLTVSYTYDARGQLTGIDDWDNAATTLTYDKVGRRKSVTRPNGVTSTHSYDTAGRLLSLLHANGGTTLAQYTYTVNARGDRTTAAENIRKADGSYDAWNIAYTYDALARVREVLFQQSGTTVRRYQYGFDVSGNRTSETVTLGAGSPTTTNWSYNAANQITNSGYTYDASGNLTSDGVNTYTWDRANRLLSTNGVQLAYDGLGNRITRTAGGVTTRTLLDLQAGLTQVLTTTTGANVTRYVHAQGDLLAHKDSAGNWEWMLPDGLGSVRGVVNNTGGVLEHRHFDPFGNLYAGTMSQSEYGFTGEPFDATSGMLYLRARHYRPANGTFVSRDPFEGTMSRPMSRNGYSWVEGRVADGRDPSGMCVGTATTALALLSQFTCSNSLTRLQSTLSVGCCGPDTTEWFLQELKNHTTYVRYINQQLQDAFWSNFWFAAIFGSQILTAGTAIEQFYDQFFGPYALAIDYGFVNYSGMAQNLGQNNHCLQSGAEQTVTFCGVCHNATDLGNLMFGAAVHAVDLGAAFNDVFAVGFNFPAERLRAFSSADTEGARVGFALAAGHNIGTMTSASQLCNALSSYGTRWHDTLRRNGCEERFPCLPSLGGAGLALASPSETNFNRYVSMSVVPIGERSTTPVEEWRQRFPLLAINN